MADDKKPVSLLLDAIAAETEAHARQEAVDRARADAERAEAEAAAAKAKAEARALAKAQAEARPAATPKAAEPERTGRPAWLGRSAAELLAGRSGRASASTDVHTGGAKEVQAPAPERRARVESTLDVHTGDAEEVEPGEDGEIRARVEARLDIDQADD